jgi:hypothetical protein
MDTVIGFFTLIGNFASFGVRALAAAFVPPFEWQYFLRPVQIRFEKSLGSATALYGTVALSFVIPSEAEGSAVLRTSPGSAEYYTQTYLSSRVPRRAVGPDPDFLPRRTRNVHVCAFP